MNSKEIQKAINDVFNELNSIDPIELAQQIKNHEEGEFAALLIGSQAFIAREIEIESFRDDRSYDFENEILKYQYLWNSFENINNYYTSNLLFSINNIIGKDIVIRFENNLKSFEEISNQLLSWNNNSIVWYYNRITNIKVGNGDVTLEYYAEKDEEYQWAA